VRCKKPLHSGGEGFQARPDLGDVQRAALASVFFICTAVDKKEAAGKRLMCVG